MADVEAERAVIAEEWRHGLGARQRSQAALLGALFGCTRQLQRHPIGELAVVDSASPDTLRRFYRRWHPPIRCALLFAPVADERTRRRAERARARGGGRKALRMAAGTAPSTWRWLPSATLSSNRSSASRVRSSANPRRCRRQRRLPWSAVTRSSRRAAATGATARRRVGRAALPARRGWRGARTPRPRLGLRRSTSCAPPRSIPRLCARRARPHPA